MTTTSIPQRTRPACLLDGAITKDARTVVVMAQSDRSAHLEATAASRRLRRKTKVALLVLLTGVGSAIGGGLAVSRLVARSLPPQTVLTSAVTLSTAPTTGSSSQNAMWQRSIAALVVAPTPRSSRSAAALPQGGPIPPPPVGPVPSPAGGPSN